MLRLLILLHHYISGPSFISLINNKLAIKLITHIVVCFMPNILYPNVTVNVTSALKNQFLLTLTENLGLRGFCVALHIII